MLMAGYYVFTSAVCVSVRSMYVHLSLHLSVCPSALLFPYNNISIYKQMEFRFCICVGIKNVFIGIVNRQVSIISDRVMALVNVQKVVFRPLVPLLFGISE